MTCLCYISSDEKNNYAGWIQYALYDILESNPLSEIYKPCESLDACVNSQHHKLIHSSYIQYWLVQLHCEDSCNTSNRLKNSKTALLCFDGFT